MRDFNMAMDVRMRTWFVVLHSVSCYVKWKLCPVKCFSARKHPLKDKKLIAEDDSNVCHRLIHKLETADRRERSLQRRTFPHDSPDCKIVIFYSILVILLVHLRETLPVKVPCSLIFV